MVATRGALLAGALALVPYGINATPDALTNAYAGNGSLASYDFTMNGRMAMRHFPWFHFHLSGRGEYVRGRSFEVDISGIPSFAGGTRRVDLSILAPSMWAHRYVVTDAGTAGSDQLYDLTDPSDPSLHDALVRVDPLLGIREVQMHYTNGSTLDFRVQCARSGGYLLPHQIEATIDAESVSVAVNADFEESSIEALSSSAAR
ncbi:MAG: hypothetical protein ACREMP_02945 [Candidatus Tyrphobacter sp.]